QLTFLVRRRLQLASNQSRRCDAESGTGQDAALSVLDAADERPCQTLSNRDLRQQDARRHEHEKAPEPRPGAEAGHDLLLLARRRSPRPSRSSPCGAAKWAAQEQVRKGPGFSLTAGQKPPCYSPGRFRCRSASPTLTSPPSCTNGRKAMRVRSSACCRSFTTSCGAWRARACAPSVRGTRFRRRRSSTKRTCG